jgi:hypothetical protein
MELDATMTQFSAEVKKVDEKEEIKEEQKMEVLEMVYNECPICYDSFEGYEVITLTACGHMFH